MPFCPTLIAFERMLQCAMPMLFIVVISYLENMLVILQTMRCLKRQGHGRSFLFSWCCLLASTPHSLPFPYNNITNVASHSAPHHQFSIHQRIIIFVRVGILIFVILKTVASTVPQPEKRCSFTCQGKSQLRLLLQMTSINLLYRTCMVATMARSNQLALLSLFVGGFLVNVTHAIVPANYTPTWFDNMFCNQENKEVLNGCVGPPTTCRKLFGWAPKDHLDCRKYVQCELIEHPANYTGPNTAKAQIIRCPGTPDAAEYSWMTRECGPWGAPGTCSWRRQFSYDDWSKICPWPSGCEHGITTRDDVLDEPASGVTEGYIRRLTDHYCKNNPEVTAGCKVKGGCRYRIPDNSRIYIQCVMDDHLGQNATTATAIIRKCTKKDDSGRCFYYSDVTKKCEPKGSPGTYTGTADTPTLPAGKVVFTNICGSLLSRLRRPEHFLRPLLPVFGDCVSYFQCLPGALGVGQVKHCSTGQWFDWRNHQCKAYNGTLLAGNASCTQRDLGIGLKLSARSDDMFVDVPVAQARFSSNPSVGQVITDKRCFTECDWRKVSDCKLPWDKDCRKYVHCADGENGTYWWPPGKAYLEECGPGHWFDPGTKECILRMRHKSMCEELLSKKPSMLEDRATRASIPAPISTEEESVILAQLKPGSYCTALDFERTGCKGSRDCVYPYLWDCFTYIKCTPDQDGKSLKPHWMWCPHGEQYSVSARMCKPAGSRGTCADANYTTHRNNEEFCNVNAVREAGCQDVTNCTYGILGYKTGYLWDKCSDYVQCKKKVRGYGKTGSAKITYCADYEEYSNQTQKCEYRGSPGTCSAEQDAAALSERDERDALVSEPYLKSRNSWIGERPRTYKTFCSVDALRGRGCEDPRKTCTYAFPNYRLGILNSCGGVIQCVPSIDGVNGTVHEHWCEVGKEFSNRTLQCEPAGSPGTCSEKKSHSIAARGNTTAEDPEEPEKPKGLITWYSDGDISIDFCKHRMEDGNCGNIKEWPLTNPKDCKSYIMATSSPARDRLVPEYKQCDSGKEWNKFRRRCDWAGAPGTCSGNTNPADYGFKCPKLPFTLEDIQNRTLIKIDPEKPDTSFPYLFPNPAGICNAVVNCYPQDQFEPQWSMMFCKPGEYWDRAKSGCWHLGSAEGQSMCKSLQNFTCPRKASSRDDCEAYNFSYGFNNGAGFRCTSAKGPEWYIACVQYEGGGKKTRPYELRCPFNSRFDLDSARCIFPNEPTTHWTKEEFGATEFGFPFDYGDTERYH